MPDISATVRTITLADATVSGLVGTRMYSDTLPQNATLPAITYFVVDTVPSETLTAIANVSKARIQIDCYAATRTDANSLGDAVRLALELYNHTVSGSQYVLAIHMVGGESHTIERSESGSDQRRFVTTQDFHVSYRQTTS